MRSGASHGSPFRELGLCVGCAEISAGRFLGHWTLCLMAAALPHMMSCTHPFMCAAVDHLAEGWLGLQVRAVLCAGLGQVQVALGVIQRVRRRGVWGKLFRKDES